MYSADCVPDLLCFLFQLPVEFRNLYETRRHRIQWGRWLWGLCCDDNRLYCVEEVWEDRKTWRLTVYDMSDSDDGSLSLIDTVAVEDVPWPCRPRVDSSHLVYVTCGRSGVLLFRCHDGRLLPARGPLMCGGFARNVCVNTADTVFVGDWDTHSVCLVNVSSDTVIRRLERPVQVMDDPYHVSALGQTVLVCYGDNTLVTYRSDSPTPARVLQTPEGLGRVQSITTDNRFSCFLVTDIYSLYVLSDKLVWHRIYTGDTWLRDCAVVQSQLWLGYRGGDIAVLTSR